MVIVREQMFFVHHTGLSVSKEQYKYLVQGEYVNFVWCETPESDHEYQAGDVRGVGGNMLMCETRQANRETREERGHEHGSDHGSDRGPDRGFDRGPDRGPDRVFDRGPDRGFDRGSDRGDMRVGGRDERRPVRVRGEGPREGEEWMLVRRKVSGWCW